MANLTVFFGIPRATVTSPDNFDPVFMSAYYELVERVLSDHKTRYSKQQYHKNHYTNSNGKPTKTLYDVIGGYYIADSCNLGTVEDGSNSYIKLYANLSRLIDKVSNAKKLAVAPHIDLNKFGHNKTIEEHVRGFKYVARTGVDIIAVHEGRGYGNAPYYWPTESRSLISSSDPALERVLKANIDGYKGNATFRDVFTGSVNEVN